MTTLTTNIYDQILPLGKLVDNTFSSCSLLPEFHSVHIHKHILLDLRSPILLEKKGLLKLPSRQDLLNTKMVANKYFKYTFLAHKNYQ